jgi:hypothetical protein
VNLDDIVFGGLDISRMNMVDAMTRENILDIDMEK